MSKKNRSCSMPKIQNNNYNYTNKYQNNQIDLYKNNNNFNGGYGIMEYNIDTITHLAKNGIACEIKQTKTINKDNKPEISTTMNFYKYERKPRQITKEEIESKVETINDYEIITKQNCITTGIIFKDHHYFETQKVIPKPKNIPYERKVTYYDDGTINYGDWRRYN